MFCPSCGTESTGLKYCNRCGANLGGLTATTEIVQVNLTKPALIIGIILAVMTLGGFALLVVGAGMLATVTQAVDPPDCPDLYGHRDDSDSRYSSDSAALEIS